MVHFKVNLSDAENSRHQPSGRAFRYQSLTGDEDRDEDEPEFYINRYLCCVILKLVAALIFACLYFGLILYLSSPASAQPDRTSDDIGDDQLAPRGSFDSMLFIALILFALPLGVMLWSCMPSYSSDDDDDDEWILNQQDDDISEEDGLDAFDLVYDARRTLI